MKSRSSKLKFVVRMVADQYPWFEGDLVKATAHPDRADWHSCIPSILNDRVEADWFHVKKDCCELAL